MQVDALYWFIGFIFFQPLHLGLPFLYILIYRKEEERNMLIRKVSISGLVSSAIVFILAFFLSGSHLYIALSLVVLSMPLAWIKLKRLPAQQE